MTSAPTAPLRLDLELRPHRSLPPRGFALVMAAVAVACAGTGIGFTLAGAWPVVGFLGLDVLAIWIAFRISYRRARAVERLWLDGDTLTLERVRPRHPPQRWSFPAHWVQVRIDDPPRPDSPLVIASHGRSVEIGSFLSPAERARVARRLRAALRPGLSSFPDGAPSAAPTR